MFIVNLQENNLKMWTDPDRVFLSALIDSRVLACNLLLTVAVLAQSVERVDCRAGGCGFNSRGQTNTQGLKITEK